MTLNKSSIKSSNPNFSEEEQRKITKNMVSQLDNEKIAYDFNGYSKAPSSLRLWGGATVKNNDMEALLLWLDWSYNLIKKND